MKYICEEPKKYPTLCLCTGCRHATECGKPCRWCQTGEAKQTFNASEDREREEAQSSFNSRMRRGII